MLTTTRDRLGAALGAVFVVLIFVGNSMNTAGTDQGSHPSGERVLRDVLHTHASTSANVGTVLEILGFTMLFGFVGYLADVTRRYGSGWRVPSATAIVGAVVMLAIKLGSVGPMAAMQLNRQTLTPQLAQLLNDMGSALFVISWLPAAIFVGATALALRDASAIGRPTLWIGVLFGIAGVASTAVGLHDISNANPLPFVLGLLWLLTVSIRLAVRPVGTQDVTASAPQPKVAVNA